MMWHVYEQCRKAKTLHEVYIATDDERIYRAAKELGMNVLMTSDKHATGTDRVAECVRYVDAGCYVNIQGDEPMIEPEAIDKVAAAMQRSENRRCMAANGYAPAESPSDVINTNVVKVVMTADEIALYYTRLGAPFPKGSAVNYKRQLGLYAFCKSGLLAFTRHDPGVVEQAEGVEMLRFLEHGYRVKMVEVENNSVAVDTLDDLARVRELIRAGANQAATRAA